MHAKYLQIEADAMEVRIVGLSAEHHLHHEDFVHAFDLRSDEELGEDVDIWNGNYELAARHQHAMPFGEGRLEIGVRDVLEHVTGVKRFDRVLTKLDEIQTIGDVIDFGAGDGV